MINKKILLIDDEAPIAETIGAYAKREQMEIIHFQNGESGLQSFHKEKYDLVILDWMLPGLSGPEIIREIRQKSQIPILMISARNDETDIVIGLELGADDYMTKPFGPRELIARIYSLLRRSSTSQQKPAVIKVLDLEISLIDKEVLKSGIRLDLTPKEFRILELLCTNLDHIVSREELMTKALGYNEFLNDRTLDTHIKNLRKKIEDNPANPRIIKTIRESGFRFCSSNET
jgi:two-component system OmpR family response regulator